MSGSAFSPETGASKQDAPKNEPKLGFFSSLAVALVVAGVFRSFFFEPFYIPSGSMKPTLLVGDYVFVSKYTYGYSRYSFPFGLPLFEGRKGGRKPVAGEIAVFKHPKQPGVNYIKRVIGVPGDKIQVRDGKLSINGKEVERSEAPSFEDKSEDGLPVMITAYSEKLPSGAIFTELDGDKQGPLDNTQVYTVPEGHYFMMGDNRDNSVDSRVLMDVGYVPFDNFVGPARMVLFSSEGQFFRIWDWIARFRPERMLLNLNPFKDGVPPEPTEGGEGAKSEALSDVVSGVPVAPKSEAAPIAPTPSSESKPQQAQEKSDDKSKTSAPAGH